ncbi:hypothetical protein B0A52_09915 [Exophiala mesophila]|uniref:Intradiol ring-cleavage dioxygenases domain-containing protein n=1 Tax=Exophiala mesophila TaxID=212818 RepID=A0A438MQS2_EXOME|nr:hypothetical protein B0A52_09915 [Exophiala mesophila]
MASNGTNGEKPHGQKLDASQFTEAVVASMGEKTPERLREVITSLTRHLHAFILETNLNTKEFMAGLELLNWAGRMSDEKRNEGLLLSDILGLERQAGEMDGLVDSVTSHQLAMDNATTTSSAILGPFWRSDTPLREFGSTMTFDTPPDAEVAYIHGVVTDAVTGEPLKNALVDVWQCSMNGLYEQQDPNQREFNLRGKFTTNDQGQYALYGIRPVPYPVPSDGPAGKLLQLLDRHPFRPAHIHYMTSKEGYATLVTQIFDRKTKYLDNDSVFATKSDLVVDFIPMKGNPNASLDLECNIALSPLQS